jgi:positive regulator of sigma E activity
MSYSYGFDWIPGGVLLGTVLLILIVPSFALIALAVVALAALAALVALAGAVLAMPYLLVRTVRRRLAERARATEAIQTPARVNVTCVTPLGEEVASTW